MKITRFTQSCLLIEDGTTRIVIDPSGHDAQTNFGKLDGVLYTHEHSDHFDPSLCDKFLKQGAVVYVNASTAKLCPAGVKVIGDNEEFTIGGIKIQARELPHCLLTDGSKGPQNTGYLLNSKLFHSGDGTVIDNLSAEFLAVPIAGPDVSFKDSCDLIRSAKAKVAIPIHYDFIGTKPDAFARFASNTGCKIHPLNNAEGVEL
jgi:L-ascorbate metabolism protein UlaG (beta-lactamase superfamily)